MPKTPPITDKDLEQPKSDLQFLQEQLVTLRNEKAKYEKEIEILKIRFENQRQANAAQYQQFQELTRSDRDKIEKQLIDNKTREDKLLLTQKEVNQLKAQIESDVQKQKDLLLRKEVELDQKLDDVKKVKADLAERLSAIPEAKNG